MFRVWRVSIWIISWQLNKEPTITLLDSYMRRIWIYSEMTAPTKEGRRLKRKVKTISNESTTRPKRWTENQVIQDESTLQSNGRDASSEWSKNSLTFSSCLWRRWWWHRQEAHVRQIMLCLPYEGGRTNFQWKASRSCLTISERTPHDDMNQERSLSLSQFIRSTRCTFAKRPSDLARCETPCFLCHVWLPQDPSQLKYSYLTCELAAKLSCWQWEKIILPLSHNICDVEGNSTRKCHIPLKSFRLWDRGVLSKYMCDVCIPFTLYTQRNQKLGDILQKPRAKRCTFFFSPLMQPAACGTLVLENNKRNGMVATWEVNKKRN